MGSEDEGEALNAVLEYLEKYVSGKTLLVPAEWVFPFWYAGSEFDAPPRFVEARKDRAAKTSVAEREGLVLQPTSSSDSDEDEVARARLRLVAASLRPAEGPERLVLRRFTAYYKDRKLIYVEDSQSSTHHVPMGHWNEYLELRRNRPHVEVLHDRLCDLRASLAKWRVSV